MLTQIAHNAYLDDHILSYCLQAEYNVAHLPGQLKVPSHDTNETTITNIRHHGLRTQASIQATFIALHPKNHSFHHFRTKGSEFPESTPT